MASAHVVEPRRDRGIDVDLRRTRQPSHVDGLQPGHEFAAADGVEAIALGQELLCRPRLVGDCCLRRKTPWPQSTTRES